MMQIALRITVVDKFAYKTKYYLPREKRKKLTVRKNLQNRPKRMFNLILGAF